MIVAICQTKQLHTNTFCFILYYKERRQLKIFLTQIRFVLPLTPIPPVICFWKWIRWKDYEVPKNRNFESVSAKKVILFSPGPTLPTSVPTFSVCSCRDYESLPNTCYTDTSPPTQYLCYTDTSGVHHGYVSSRGPCRLVVSEVPIRWRGSTCDLP
jgi:hypothetical protein